MQFFKRKWPNKIHNAKFPYVILTTDNWNDYGYCTSFDAYYFGVDEQEIEIGNVKILHEYNASTQNILPDKFTELSSEFCSLGQELFYYEKLSKLNSSEAQDILKSLNDVAANPGIRKKFERLEGFSKSLLRWSEAEKALNEAMQFFGTQKTAGITEFEFKCRLPGAEDDHILNFDFRNNEYFPYRLNVLIGKNGTGKTQVLSRMANALSGYKAEKQGAFSPTRPLFSKVIAISYSAFDMFEKPHQVNEEERGRNNLMLKSSFSYVYCGLQGTEGTYSLQEVKENFINSFERIKNKGRTEKWRKILCQVIERDQLSFIDEIENGNYDVNISSGQSILLSSITEAISHIEEESIILFDEPEIHLHPNAMANLIRMLYALLNEFNSYAIISTHSPLIIQETPSRYVTVIERYGTIPRTRKLGIECFGENISSIVQEAFDVNSSESSYKTWLNKLAQSMHYEQINAIFDNKLSLNAMVFLKKIFSDRNRGL